MKNMQKRRGISPVIATVIIVAVTIAVAIAVAFWMTGIVGLFTGFEQIQITTVYDDDAGIHILLRNTGTSTVAITEVYLNNFPLTTVLHNSAQFACDNALLVANQPITINPGQDLQCILTFNDQPQQFNVRPGTSLEIKLHSAGGKDYPKVIVIQSYSP
jgi:flagellin-like protein